MTPADPPTDRTVEREPHASFCAVTHDPATTACVGVRSEYAADRTVEREPQTAAGRALHDRLLNHGCDFDRSILAIEAEASTLPAAPERPEIVVLCGSTRFYDDFQQANYDHTMAGRIVLSVGFYPHSKAAHGHGEGVGHDSAEKVALDELHKRKIDLGDWVYVLNRGGYIGESTRGEIEYAIEHGKPVRYAFDTDGVGSIIGWLQPDHDLTNAKVGR